MRGLEQAFVVDLSKGMMGNIVSEMLRALRLVYAVVPCDVMLRRNMEGSKRG